MAGDQRKDRAAGAGGAAVAVGHAGHGKRGGFDRFGHAAQRSRIGLGAVIEIERGRGRAQQQLGIGQTGVAVGRGEPRHRDRAAGEFGQRRIAKVGRPDRGRPAAREDAQADVFGFGRFDIFEPAQTHRDALRRAGHEHCIAGLRTGGLGLADQRRAAFLRLIG